MPCRLRRASRTAAAVPRADVEEGVVPPLTGNALAHEAIVVRIHRSSHGRFPLVSAIFGRVIISRSGLEASMRSWDARAQNSHVEATSDHPFPARATATSRTRTTLGRHGVVSISREGGWVEAKAS